MGQIGHVNDNDTEKPVALIEEEKTRSPFHARSKWGNSVRELVTLIRLTLLARWKLEDEEEETARAGGTFTR